jgi:uncharacterized protein (TIGR02646 family)
MHKLDRSAAPAPACLARYSPDTDTWDNVSSEDRREIRAALEQMQGQRCAYCESWIAAHGQHIEHFRRKNPKHFPERSFAWENLFWSCDELESCGHFKDRKGQPYNPDDLIKPDEDDPDEFLYFHSRGDVRLRPRLDAAKAHRAGETIRVFNLQRSELQALRRGAVARYQRQDPDMLQELEAWDEETRWEYLAAEVSATAGDPYATTIRHFLERHR